MKKLGRIAFAVMAVFVAVTASAETGLHYTLLSPPAYTNEWKAYLDMRAETRPDVAFSLVDAMDIYTNALYRFDANATGGAPRNPAESIHAWIRARMRGITDPDERAKHYFVLGGSFVDAQTVTGADDARLQKYIPGVYVRPRFSPDANIQAGEPYYSISDMFYACLDVRDGEWPWDANKNGKYADNQESGTDLNDYLADVVVARIPVEKHSSGAKAVIAAFKEKVARVEDPAFAGCYRFALAGGQCSNSGGRLDVADGRTLRDEHEFYDGGLNMFDPRHGGMWIDSELVPRQTVKNTTAARRPVLEGNPLFVYGWGADHPSIDVAVSHFYSHDYDYLEYRDHGSASDLYCKYINADAYLKATGLTRMIISGFSCMTGYIDGSGISLAEAEILSPHGGTVASVHNSRYGVNWAGTDLKDNAGLSSTLQYLIKQGVLEKDMDLGRAWLYARQQSAANEGLGLFVSAEQLLLGDPLIKMSPSVPETTLAATEIAVTEDTGYTTLNVKGGTTIAGAKLFKVMTRLNVTDGDTLRFAVNGGVGTQGVSFASGNGTLTVASPGKAYFVQPSGAREVVLAGSGTTLDFEQAMPQFATLTLRGEGETRRTGNVLRGRTEGQLKSLLPLSIENTEVALGTVDAFKGASSDRLAAVKNGGLGITFNPNYGLENCWEYLSGAVELDGGTLFADRTTTAGFGRETAGLAVAVRGEASVETRNGGRITLFGTTAFELDDAATLTLDATFLSDEATHGRVLVSGGKTVVADDSGLSGEVVVTDGTLVLTEIPLRNVSRLALQGRSKLVMPMDGSGYYQILSKKGAVLEMGDEVVVASAADEETAVSGKATSNGAFFDLAQFIVWDKASGADWTSAWSGGKKVYFPEVPSGDEVVVRLPESLTCSFVAFGNTRGTYRFTGEKLTLGAAVLTENVVFDNEVFVSTSTLVTGGNVSFGVVTTPVLEVQDGACVSATKILNEIKTIRGVRFYPLKTNGGDGKSIAIFELQFNTSAGKLPLGSSSFAYSTGSVASLAGQANLWNGSCAGIEAMFGSDNCCFITANSVDDLAKGKVYLQFDFATDQPMIVNYGLAASGNNATNTGKSLTDFRVEVSPDGSSWVPVSEVQDTTVPKAGTGEMWYGMAHTAFGISNPPADVDVRKGGTLVLAGEVSGTVRLDAGGILKVAPTTALAFAEGSALVVPEEGVVFIDCSAAELSDSVPTQTILTGVTLTDAQRARLAPRGRPWMKLVAEEGGLVLMLDKHPPKVLFR